MSYAGSSQNTTTDTLCAPTRVWRNLLTIAKQKEVQDSLVGVYRSDIDILQGKVNLLEEKDRNSTQIASAYQSQVDILNKEVKKWKRKTRWAGIGGIVLTGLVTTLFIIK
jgi:hypothetical protein